MKMETLVMISALILVALLGSLMAFNTAMGQMYDVEIELQEVVALRDAEIVSLREELIEERTPQPYCLPLEQLWVSSGTGYRMNPMGGTEEKVHDGTDFAAPEGTPVKAVLGGVVGTHYLPPDGGIWKGDPIYGAMIEIKSEDELLFRYGHFSKTFVHEGDVVKAGDVIGLVVSTGMSTAPHLHLQVIVSPVKYLEERR